MAATKMSRAEIHTVMALLMGITLTGCFQRKLVRGPVPDFSQRKVLDQTSEILTGKERLFQQQIVSTVPESAAELNEEQSAKLRAVTREALGTAFKELDRAKFALGDKFYDVLDSIKAVCDERDFELSEGWVVNRNYYVESVRHCYGSSSAALRYLLSSASSLPIIFVRADGLGGPEPVAVAISLSYSNREHATGTTVFQYKPREAALYSVVVGDPSSLQVEPGTVQILTMTSSATITVQCYIQPSKTQKKQRWNCIPSDVQFSMAKLPRRKSEMSF
jgi:hypothetical protein